MDETIGTDMDSSINRKKDDNVDRDLFEIVSDTYNKTPAKLNPLSL